MKRKEMYSERDKVLEHIGRSSRGGDRDGYGAGLLDGYINSVMRRHYFLNRDEDEVFDAGLLTELLNENGGGYGRIREHISETNDKIREAIDNGPVNLCQWLGEYNDVPAYCSAPGKCCIDCLKTQCDRIKDILPDDDDDSASAKYIRLRCETAKKTLDMAAKAALDGRCLYCKNSEEPCLYESKTVSGEPFNARMMDLARFKAMNDRVDYIFGNHILAWLEDTAINIIDEVKNDAQSGTKDVKYNRVGGDEYLIYVPDTRRCAKQFEGGGIPNIGAAIDRFSRAAGNMELRIDGLLQEKRITRYFQLTGIETNKEKCTYKIHKTQPLEGPYFTLAMEGLSFTRNSGEELRSFFGSAIKVFINGDENPLFPNKTLIFILDASEYTGGGAQQLAGEVAERLSAAIKPEEVRKCPDDCVRKSSCNVKESLLHKVQDIRVYPGTGQNPCYVIALALQSCGSTNYIHNFDNIFAEIKRDISGNMPRGRYSIFGLNRKVLLINDYAVENMFKP